MRLLRRRQLASAGPAQGDVAAARALLATSPCQHCGGYHDRACPRVRRIRFRSDGQSVDEVEFWRDWPTDGVYFPADLRLLSADDAPAAP